MKNNIRIFIVLGLVFGFISGTALGTIKLGTDDSGQGWFGDDTGLIVCSNGKSFPATQIGLQAAIYSLNSTNGGWVRLPAGNISVTSEIKINHYAVSLYGAGIGIYPPTQFSVTQLKAGAEFDGYLLNISGFSGTKVLQGITISDIVFNGAETTEVGAQLRGGIHVDHVYNSNFRNLYIAKFYRNDTIWGCGLNITGRTYPDGVNYYNYIEQVQTSTCRIGVCLGVEANACVMIGGHIGGGPLTGRAIGLYLNEAGTFVNYATDIDELGDDNQTAIVIRRATTATIHRFFGTRFEGNFNNIYIINGGYHKFIGCVISPATNKSVQDSAWYKSEFIACSGYKTDHQKSTSMGTTVNSTVIIHYLSVTPNVINIMPTSNYTNSVTQSNIWWVSLVNSTSFTVNLAYKPSKTFTFTWEAKYMANLNQD